MMPGADILAPGERVRIRALKDIGSARLLDGLTGQVLGPHPLARGWYKLHLDPNTITPYSDWSALRDRLRRMDEKNEVQYIAESMPELHFP